MKDEWIKRSIPAYCWDRRADVKDERRIHFRCKSRGFSYVQIAVSEHLILSVHPDVLYECVRYVINKGYNPPFVPIQEIKGNENDTNENDTTD